MDYKEKIKIVTDLLVDSECILIGAGAGLSVDAGNDYMDKEFFMKNYPELVKLGFNSYFCRRSYWESKNTC